MDSNDVSPPKDTTNINVELPNELHTRLKRLMLDLKLKTWRLMLEKCAFVMEVMQAEDVNRRSGL